MSDIKAANVTKLENPVLGIVEQNVTAGDLVIEHILNSDLWQLRCADEKMDARKRYGMITVNCKKGESVEILLSPRRELLRLAMDASDNLQVGTIEWEDVAHE